MNSPPLPTIGFFFGGGGGVLKREWGCLFTLFCFFVRVLWFKLYNLV
jgi:hypothetical protein